MSWPVVEALILLEGQGNPLFFFRQCHFQFLKLRFNFEIAGLGLKLGFGVASALFGPEVRFPNKGLGFLIAGSAWRTLAGKP